MLLMELSFTILLAQYIDYAKIFPCVSLYLSVEINVFFSLIYFCVQGELFYFNYLFFFTISQPIDVSFVQIFQFLQLFKDHLFFFVFSHKGLANKWIFSRDRIYLLAFGTFDLFSPFIESAANCFLIFVKNFHNYKLINIYHK